MRTAAVVGVFNSPRNGHLLLEPITLMLHEGGEATAIRPYALRAKTTLLDKQDEGIMIRRAR